MCIKNDELCVNNDELIIHNWLIPLNHTGPRVRSEHARWVHIKKR